MIMKDKIKHTSGKWKVGYYNSNTNIYADKEGTAEYICEFDGQNKQVEANAKLIAAAPEMLELLKAVLHTGLVYNKTRILEIIGSVS